MGKEERRAKIKRRKKADGMMQRSEDEVNYTKWPFFFKSCDSRG